MTPDQARAISHEAQRNAPAVELMMGDPVAWISRDHDRANAITAIHRYYEEGKTFCRLAVPPSVQHLPLLESLKVCGRCRAMSARALRYAQAAGQKVSA